MTNEELAALKARITEEEVSQERRKRDAIEAYKDLVSETISESFNILQAQSRELAKSKSRVYGMFETVRSLKAELFKTKEAQWSHTFTNKENNRRITLGTHTLDSYDDTAEDGIAMVNDYLDSLAEGNEGAAQAVAICRSLMARDRKGNLKPSKIVTLYTHAKKSGSRKFMEGVEVIMNAYRPVASKTYIRAEYRNDKGEWIAVPLGMTEVNGD